MSFITIKIQFFIISVSEHNTKLDVDNSNRELTQRDYNLWDALECSKWMPVECYD